LGREVATPVQRGFNASLLGSVQAVKLMRHHALQPSQSRPSPPWSSIERIRFKVVPPPPAARGGVLVRRMPPGSPVKFVERTLVGSRSLLFDPLYELEQYDANARRWRTFLARRNRRS
jgi:hypothetical protein